MLYSVLDDKHLIGQKKRVGAHSTVYDHLAVIFEDDGETGYFYAINMEESQPVVDSLVVYNVSAIEALQEPRRVQICWSEDGLKAFLVINTYPHAVFDFEKRVGYNSSKYPLPELDSFWNHELVTDELANKWLLG